MKISEQWLREWVNPPLDTQQLADQLTMAGLEIENVTPVAGKFDHVVIGKVIKAEQHPNADRLRVCQVDVGQPELLNIVCGAANVRADLKVAVAMIGAKLPGDFTIKESKLRGVLSQGMICSAKELEIEGDAEGIMELEEDAPIGRDFREWLRLDDQVLDVHVTPNRGDCLSVMGLAREIAALNHCERKADPDNKVIPTITDTVDIKVSAPEACPRYLGRVIRGINYKAQTPVEIKERLRRSGIRAIHPVVDITNYVLLELGQPMHAFDLAKLNGGIEVRFAHEQEKIILLSEQEINLDKTTLVIADQQQAQALAGVMGGLHSAVSATTADIFLESAFFNPLTVAGRARKYGLSTDGAYRFERGVDAELPRCAIERATELLLQIVGGKAGPIAEVKNENYLPKPTTIVFRKKRLERVLGTIIPEDKIDAILKNLGMQFEHQDIQNGIWKITAPSYRYDLTLEEDVIEELARIHGYQNIPAKKPQQSLHFLPQFEQSISMTRLRNILVDRGYHEAITYSFISPKLHSMIDPQRTGIALANPISADLSVMRSSLWPGLLNAAAYNQNRQQTRVRLFETGLSFVPAKDDIKQEAFLAGVIAGNAYPEQWGMAQRAVDFFDIKNDLETLFELTGQAVLFAFQKVEHPALHPGQCGAILYQGKQIGYVGALHPALLQSLELIGPVYLFELPLTVLTTAKLPQFQVFSKFPAVRRDISFWIDAQIPVQNILDLIRKSAGEWLYDVSLFDVYQDKKMAVSKRSLALGLVWQHPDRTLVDTEVNEAMEKIIAALKQALAIELRE
jgi:phenylalanyl-tRNA synthetase beta chain